MKKTILLIAALITFAASTNAEPVSTEWAQKVAMHFWNSYRPTDVKPATTVTPLAFPELEHLHIFDINGEGFVIVSGDDRVTPVLAYSFSSTASEELNPETGYWLRGYEAQIAEMANSDMRQPESLLQEWIAPLLVATPEEPVASLLDIPAMMRTHWDQSNPYNLLCPFDSTRNARTVVGCVATAMAQIMRYWSYPAYGEGFHTYSYGDLGDISADFENTSYLWHIMPNVCDDFSSATAKTATATISFHCGVAVEMMYGTSGQGGSAAYSSCGTWASHCATSAFIDYFKYDPSLFHASRMSYSDTAWQRMLDTEMEAGRPVYYSGHDSTGGHAFVFDGADIQGRYHVNWGWGGSYDGFYTVDRLSPGGGGDGGNATYTFNQGQGAIFGIKPGMQEVFDTVDYYDSICNNSQYTYFRDYKLLVVNVAGHDTLLHHFDTVFNYHLSIINQKKMYINPNNGESVVMKMYCPATGYTFPQCSYHKDNCIFVGWCRNRDGNDNIYQPGETAYFNNTPTFYALWVDTSTAVGLDTPEGDGVPVWPSVTRQHVNISIADAETLDITVIDNCGRVLIQEKGVGGKAKISLERLPAGTYTVQILTKDTLYKSRIIKL